MKPLQPTVLFVIALFTCGCSVPLFHEPLYTNELLTDEPRLEGKWAKVVDRDWSPPVRDGARYQEIRLTRTAKGTYSYTCDGDKAVAHVIRLGELLFIDIELSEAVLRKHG